MFYSIEGFECLRTPRDFEEFYDLGIRSYGFTWSFDNEYACGRHTKNDTGLSKRGEQVLSLMRNKGKLIIDIAHLSELSVKDMSRLWDGVFVTTHGNTRSIDNSTHNITDDEVKLIVERNGVVSLFPLVGNTGGKGKFEDLYRHLDYIASKWGIDHVAFSTDIYPLPEFPFVNNAQDITIAKDWADYLLTRLDQKTVVQILYGNWMRVLKENL